MSFGSSLLGKPSHDALIKLLENEIKLLEAIKRTFALRMKCERDYSQSLTQSLLHNSKLEAPSYESLVYAAWERIVLDISQTCQISKKRSEDLQRICDKLGCLIKEKVSMKKTYSKERDRIDDDLLKTMHSRLNQKQNQYTKMDEEAANAHKIYDQEVIKGKVNAIDRAQDKYRKTVMKLHKYHNDYVLQLEDAKLHQTHYRTHILPQILDGLQHLETEFVVALKNIFADYTHCTSPCLDEIVSRHNLTVEKTSEIDAALEHNNFMDANKSDLENEAELKYPILTGEGVSLLKGEIILNSLTLQEVENYANDYTDDVAVIEEQVKEDTKRLQTLHEESQNTFDQDNPSTWFPKHQEYVQAKLSLNEQEDLLVRLKHLLHYVSVPMTNLAGKEPPPGIDFPDLDCGSGTLSTPTTPGANDNYAPTFLFTFKKKLSNIKTFANTKSGADDSKVTSPTGNSPRRLPNKAKSFSAADMVHKYTSSPPRFMNKPPKYQAPLYADSDSQNVPKHPAPLPPTSANRSFSTFNSPLDSSKPIQEQSCFHGVIPREESEVLLFNDGDFLLRRSKKNKSDVVLSAKCHGQFRHFILKPGADGRYHFGGATFGSVFEMISHFYNSKVPMSQTDIHLSNPIEKDQWQLTHDDIEMKEELGSGNYGTVFRGVMASTGLSVAVKTCKATVDNINKAKFLMEARILKGYDHPNIVKLIGVATDKQPIYIVMELVTGGDLRDFLQKNIGCFDQHKLVRLCRDACAGMAYLEGKNCIHRDVAARNCLVDDQEVVKISDFGMSRQEDDGVYTMSGANKRVPMRWTPPEAIYYGKYTTASDVWSFGILSWEVFAYGTTPYPGMTNVMVHDQILTGYRMPQQTNCPKRYYDEVMRPSWLEDANKRPRFVDIVSTIEDILKSL